MTQTYKVEIVETLTRLVDIEAENPDDAETKARNEYENGNIVLNAEDCDGDVSINEIESL